jgi:hypothetical protein
MSRRVLIVLAVTAALLLGYVLLFEREPRDVDGERRRVLPGLQRERVARIRIVCSTPRSEVELRRGRAGEGGTWRLAPPRGGRADPEILSRLLALLEFLEPLRTVPADTNRRQLGLLPPQATVALSDAKERPMARLALGRPDPSGHGVYLDHRGALFVVDRELLDLATGGIDAWRDRRLAPAWAATRVARIRVKRAGLCINVEVAKHQVRLRLERDGWIRVDPAAARRLLAALAGLRAARFIPRRGDLDAAKVTVEGRGGALALEVGGPCPGRPAERRVLVRERGEEPVSCCVEREDLSAFTGASEDSLVDRRLVHGSEVDLERIKIQTRGARIELVRDAGRWREDPGGRAGSAGKAGAAADGVAIREWMAGLAGLAGRVERGGGLERRQATIELGGGPDQPTRVLRFGEARGGELPVRRDDEQALVWIPQRQAQAVLSIGRYHFRSRQVLELSRHVVSRLVTRRGAEREVLVRDDEGWKLVEPVRAPVDQAHVAALLRAVSRLRATRLLERLPSGTRDEVTLVLSVQREQLGPGDAGPSAEEVTRLHLSVPRSGAGPCFAGSRAPWFELEPAVCRLLSRRRADRRLLRGSEAMTRIAISMTGTRIQQDRRLAEKRGPTWHDGGTGKALDTTAVAELVQALRNLRGQPRYDLKLAAPTLEVRVRTADGRQEGFLVDGRGRSRRLSGGLVFELDREEVARLRRRAGAIPGR